MCTSMTNWFLIKVKRKYNKEITKISTGKLGAEKTSAKINDAETIRYLVTRKNEHWSMPYIIINN